VAIITISDLEARWRSLTSAEEAIAPTLIEDVEAWAMLAVPTLEAALVDPSAAFLQNVKRIFATAVIRVLKNPQAYRSESDGDYSYSFDRVVSSGELNLSQADLRMLGGGRRRFYSATIGDDALDLIGRPSYPEAWSEVES
jgi:hypothetical protein